MSIFVLYKVYPLEKKISLAQKVVNEYFDIVKSDENCLEFDLLTNDENQIVWTETWKNGNSLEAFLTDKLPLTPVFNQMFDISRKTVFTKRYKPL